MKATELRIGNLVERNGKIHEVSSIHSDNTIRLFDKDRTVSIGCFSLKEINPIPITEEWLLKFGFEQNFEETEMQRFKYVHQLQNICFCLFNKELSIKNKTL
jgi:hypothetical protein